MAPEVLIKALSPNTHVVVRGDADYENAIMRWSLAAVKRANIIVYVLTPADVAACILFTRTQQPPLDLATVCGGHATSGSSSSSGGLVIDLSRMLNVVVDPEKRLIYVDGGCTWADVDREAWKHGLATVGGTVSHTGVGGLSLGGGYGFLNGVHGLVVDNIVEIEMVLASGEIVRANEKQNEDLFWAVRGAGTNFGIATQLIYRAHPQAAAWCATLVFAPSQLARLVDLANANFARKNGNSNVWLVYANPPPLHTPAILAVLFYNGPESRARSHYAAFLALPGVEMVGGMMSYPELNCVFDASFGHGLRRSMKGSAFMPPLDIELAERLLVGFTQFTERYPDARDSAVALEFTPFEKIVEVGQRETAFANRGPYGGILCVVGWTEKGLDEVCRAWTREMSEVCKVKFQAERGALDGVGEYCNYDGLGITGNMAFGVNHPRLMELKKRYDPENVFNKGVDLTDGGFSLLSRATK